MCFIALETSYWRARDKVKKLKSRRASEKRKYVGNCITDIDTHGTIHRQRYVTRVAFSEYTADGAECPLAREDRRRDDSALESAILKFRRDAISLY